MEPGGAKQSRWGLGLLGCTKADAAEPRVDPSCGLADGAWLQRHAEELEDRSLFHRSPIAVLRFRIDDHGLATEEELVDVADRMQSRLRAYERFFRLGPHDFALLVPGSDAEGARRVGAKVQGAVGVVSMWRGGTMHLLCGISSSLDGEPFVYEWVAGMADKALDQAAQNGGLAVAESVRSDRLRVVGEGPSEEFPDRH